MGHLRYASKRRGVIIPWGLATIDSCRFGWESFSILAPGYFTKPQTMRLDLTEGSRQLPLIRRIKKSCRSSTLCSWSRATPCAASFASSGARSALRPGVRTTRPIFAPDSIGFDGKAAPSVRTPRDVYMFVKQLDPCGVKKTPSKLCIGLTVTCSLLGAGSGCALRPVAAAQDSINTPKGEVLSNGFISIGW